MQILSQDGKRLINGDYVSSIYISETPDEVKLMAAADEDIVLGTYATAEHAEMVLRFIGVCSVDPDTQNKITTLPTRDDMELKDSLFDGGLNPEGIKKLLKQVLTKGGQPQK